MTDKFDVIQLLFDSYNGEYTDGNLKAYVANLAAFSDQTVAMAVRNFTNGKVDRNGSFRPSSEELFKECDRIVNVDRIRKELEIAARKKAYEKSNLVRLPKNHFMNKYKPGSKFKG
ncbi:MAG: hypothetical protein GY928_12065 [Colwellia sp.]|nr:hypothetical protein [Colwellia sp.]